VNRRGETTAVQTNAVSTQRTEHDIAREKMLEALDRIGAKTIGEDGLVFQGTKFVLPSTMNGRVDDAIAYLMEYKETQETEFSFSRHFNYRPWDGAAAFDRAMKRVFGTAGVGKSIQTMFGKIPPQYKTIAVGPNQEAQVPWGRVGFSPIEAEFTLGATRVENFGVVFQLHVSAPRKYRTHIEAFFQVVDQELRTGSIYRGKAITGGGEPNFLDTDAIDPDKVVYSPDTMVQLDTNMWSLLRYTDNMRKNGITLKRAVLVEGPYGTGKTLAGMLTAKEAVANGWTFILARPGQDDLMEVLETAQLYAPAVVWYEDIDTIGKGHSDMQISRLLDVLDGITNKGTEVLAGFTTNHAHKIQKGVLRPGRLDAVIHIGHLDADGFQKLVRTTIPKGQLGEVDFDAVGKAFDGLLPAFAKEAINRAMQYSMARNAGELGVITTEDLVHAADGLRPQLAMMEAAQEGVKEHTLDTTFRQLFSGQLDGVRLIDEDGDPWNGVELEVPGHKALNGAARHN